DRIEAPETYELMLQDYYPSFPNWHEDPRSKSKEPFNPHNSQEGCAGETSFLKKYKEKAPELFKELMQMRIEYFEKLKK
ncbi:hypothetical protein KY315_02175, partial [Candidatus Woesearchaeota archaeon]|nr:hypothetical protein [Candidatus Woesearchaeota archaeon]